MPRKGKIQIHFLLIFFLKEIEIRIQFDIQEDIRKLICCIFHNFLQTFAILNNLNPYSVYEIEISGSFEKKKLFWTFEATTIEGVPQVRPIKLDNSSLLFVQAITFYWASPFPGTCELRNGKSNGYR
jgi:hypothetical protein